MDNYESTFNHRVIFLLSFSIVVIFFLSIAIYSVYDNFTEGYFLFVYEESYEEFDIYANDILNSGKVKSISYRPSNEDRYKIHGSKFLVLKKRLFTTTFDRDPLRVIFKTNDLEELKFFLSE